MIPSTAKDPGKVRLLGVADAAESSAGAAIYAGYELMDGTYGCSLLNAKSRMVSKTIPRNELEGVMILAEMMSKLRSGLEHVLIEEHYFTDSTIAMCWCSNMTLKLKMYVRFCLLYTSPSPRD